MRHDVEVGETYILDEIFSRYLSKGVVDSSGTNSIFWDHLFWVIDLEIDIIDMIFLEIVVMLNDGFEGGLHVLICFVQKVRV